MAVNIYKSQIGSKPCALNTQLSAALCYELTHMQDFLTKLFEFGFKPSKLRWTYWLVGYVFGLSSRPMGEAVILKTAVWTEEKAIAHYAELLARVPWDEETRSFDSLTAPSGSPTVAKAGRPRAMSTSTSTT